MVQNNGATMAHPAAQMTYSDVQAANRAANKAADELAIAANKVADAAASAANKLADEAVNRANIAADQLGHAGSKRLDDNTKSIM